MTVSWQVRRSAGRGGWRRGAGWLMFAIAVFALVLAALGVAVWDGLAHWGDVGNGVSVTINGADVTRSFDISGWPPAHKLMLVVALALVLMALLLVIPLALLIGSVALTVLVVAVVALPVLIGLLVVAAVTGPLWLLIWWLVVRSRRARPVQAATIDA